MVVDINPTISDFPPTQKREIRNNVLYISVTWWPVQFHQPGQKRKKERGNMTGIGTIQHTVSKLYCLARIIGLSSFIVFARPKPRPFSSS